MENKKENGFFGIIMGKWNQKEYTKMDFTYKKIDFL